METEVKKMFVKQNNNLFEVKNTNNVEFTTEPIMTKDEIVKYLTPEKEASFTCTLESTLENGTINELLFRPSATNVHVEDGIGEMMRELKELKARVNRTVALVHNCQRCGATLEVDEHKAIFCCKYCGATYLLGAIQPNSVYN